MSEHGDYLPKGDEFTKLDGGKAVFLLGTDVHIGEPDTCEQRVGITADQAGALKTWLEARGVDIDIFVVRGAGERAGNDDAAYEAVGCTIIDEADLGQMTPHPHVVHALKESTAYEAGVPGPFARIGALHSGDFHPEAGWAKVLLAGNSCAILDGSNIGGFAYNIEHAEVKPKFPVPLRSSMSQYAGWLAAEDVGAKLQGSGNRVIVSGGGVVGTSSVDQLLETYRDQLDEIVIIEKFPEVCERLRTRYADAGIVTIQEGFEVSGDDLDGAAGLILTIFIQGMTATDKVVDLERLKRMKQGSCIVDVSCDEGGTIALETGSKVSEPIEVVRAAVEGLDLGLTYEADNHMPRRRPREASIEHGRAVLMYLAVLLYLSAREGGPEAMIKFIMDQDYGFQPKDLLNALALDLKHGMAFSKLGGTTVCYRHVLKRCDEIHQFLNSHDMPAVFA